MPDTAIIVTATEPRIESCLEDLALHKLGHSTVIGHLFRRLDSGMLDKDYDFVVIILEGGLAGSILIEQIIGTRFRLFTAARSSPLGYLVDFAAATPDIKSLVVYPELAGFPDVVTALDMISAHSARGAHVTYAQGMPAGFLPVIFSVNALHQLIEMELPPECERDILRLMTVSNKLLGGQSEFAFVIDNYDAAGRHNLDPATLPSSVLLTDEYRRRAADLVTHQIELASSFDSAEAVKYKEFRLDLLDISKPRRRESCRGAANGDPIRVLFTTSARAYSGAEASWVELIGNLDRSEFHPIVLLPCESTTSDILTKSGVDVRFAHCNVAELTVLNFSFWTRFLREHRIELVDINASAGVPLLACSQNAQIPILTHVRAFNSCGMENELQFCDLIVTVSNALRKDVLRNEIRPEKVVTVYNGVDVEKVRLHTVSSVEARKTLTIPLTSRVVTMVARIAPEKRYEMFLSLVARLIQSTPELVVLCVGEVHYGQQEHFARLKALAVDLGLAPVVRWLGFRRDLDMIYAASDLLVVCNPLEPLPRCAIEACAAGLPVVGPRSGGMLEIIEEDCNGLMFPPDDVENAAAVVERCLGDPSLQSRFRVGARAVAARFSTRSHILQMSSLFRSLIRHDQNNEMK